jgi:hypothetical protein
MTREEYIHAVSHLIRSSDRAAPTGAGLKASTLGNLILRALPDHWTRHGYPTLKEMLLDLRDRELITVGTDSQKMLAVWITESFQVPAPEPPAQLQRLKREIWAAFVKPTPPGLRFLQRTTGAVLMGQVRPPLDHGGWVPIPVLSEETQKGWAKELLGQSHIDGVRGALDEPMWYLRLPEMLRRFRPEALPQWNRIRSTKVAAAVAIWCKANNIPIELVADDGARQRPTSLTPGASRGPPRTTGDRDVRQQVLSALALMSTEELLNLSIPAKYLLSQEPKARA